MTTAVREEQHPLLLAGAVICVLNVIDVTMTRWLLSHGAHEVNPLMSPIIGTHAALALKLFLPPAVVFGFLRLKQPVFASRALKSVAILYMAVVAWNIVISYWRYT